MKEQNYKLFRSIQGFVTTRLCTDEVYSLSGGSRPSYKGVTANAALVL